MIWNNPHRTHMADSKAESVAGLRARDPAFKTDAETRVNISQASGQTARVVSSDPHLRAWRCPR